MVQIIGWCINADCQPIKVAEIILNCEAIELYLAAKCHQNGRRCLIKLFLVILHKKEVLLQKKVNFLLSKLLDIAHQIENLLELVADKESVQQHELARHLKLFFFDLRVDLALQLMYRPVRFLAVSGAIIEKVAPLTLQ